MNSALGQGIAPAVVVAIYLIITKIIDNRKERTQIKISAELTKSITIISNFVSSVAKNIVDKDKDKCRIAIRDSLNCAAYELISFVTDTLVNNHIVQNEETIKNNIKNIANAAYYNVYTTLSLYNIDGRKVSEFIKPSWLSEIEESLNKSIFHDSMNREEKIISFANRIDIRFKSYETYITNNALK